MPRKPKQTTPETEPLHSTGEEGYLYKDGEQPEGKVIETPHAVEATAGAVATTVAPPEATQVTEKSEQAQEEKKPRIHGLIFTGDGEPKRNVRIGMLEIILPDAEIQRKGFETEHAKLIRTNLKGYKPFNPLAKG